RCQPFPFLQFDAGVKTRALEPLGKKTILLPLLRGLRDKSLFPGRTSLATALGPGSRQEERSHHGPEPGAGADHGIDSRPDSVLVKPKTTEPPRVLLLLREWSLSPFPCLAGG